MKLTISRTLIALTLALGLTACGGKASFEIKGTITGLVYDGLKLTETSSGKVLSINKSDTTFSFGNVDYGQTFAITIASVTTTTNGTTTTTTDQPLHQFCTVTNGADTAGRTASINAIISCTINTHSVGGLITVTPDTGATAGSIAGLKIINGSQTDAFVAVVGTTSYSFGSIPFDQTVGLIIAGQPTDPKTTCKLAPTAPLTASTDGLSVTTKMGDLDIVVPIACKTTI
jgi:hypothetical protein